MAWSIRSLAEGSARVRGAFRQYMPGTDSALKNNFVTVTAKVLAALAHEFELRMAYLVRQMFLTTATGDYLALHAGDVGIYRKAASAASGLVTGMGAAGETYPAGIRLLSGGDIYVSTAAATAGGDGALTLPVTSSAFAASANRDGGGLLALADPVLWPDLSPEWEISSAGLGGGADAETNESLRERALQRKRNPPGGGTLSDYERIARSVPGVVKAWAFQELLSPGFVVVLFLFDGRENLIPEASDVATVQAAIDGQRLIRVDDSIASAPLPLPVNIQIGGLSGDTEDIRAAIAAGVSAMFLERCRPGIDSDPFVLSRSWIAEAISQAAGEERHRLIAPAADIVLTGGHFPVLGSVTYVA